MTQRVVIVGAGISGLALAYRLQKAAPNADIFVLEERDRVGGTVWTVEREGFRVECGPNGFLGNNPSTLNLCRDLGLADQLIAGSSAARRNRYLCIDGTLQALPTSLAGMIATRVLSWRGKLDLLAEPLRRRRPIDCDESIDTFLRRRAGCEMAEVLGDALVTGIFAGDARMLSVRACFPRLVALEDRYGSLVLGWMRSARQKRERANGIRAERGVMWSFRAGLRELVERLAAVLKRPPLLHAAVRNITKTDGEWRVSAEGHGTLNADVLVLTCPAYRQAALLESIDAELAEHVGGIAYNRVAVVALGYREQAVPRKLDGFGFLAGQNEHLDLLGAQWCSSIYPERAPSGTVLIRALCGGWHRPEIVGWDDQRLLGAMHAGLVHTMHVSEPPLFHHIVRWDRAIPQYLLGHPERVAQVEKLAERHRGLVLAGNAYRGVSLNDCTEEGERLAVRIADWLRIGSLTRAERVAPSPLAPG